MITRITPKMGLCVTFNAPYWDQRGALLAMHRRPRGRTSMKLSRLPLALMLVAVALAPRVFAQSSGVETKVMIRAIARDAKVIGEHVGGARITVKDASTGQVLAQGMQSAGTGDTDLIMKKPRVRGATVYGTPDSSGFLAVLHIDKPTEVEITAEAAARHATSHPACIDNDAAGAGPGRAGRRRVARNSRLYRQTAGTADRCKDQSGVAI